MNSIIQEMLNKYNCVTKEEYVNAFKEIVQEVALYSLSLTDFFDNAAFYGGTALRIFYNLDRFSEDLDFSLCVKDASFSLEKYFETLTKNFEILGLNFVPQIKEKTVESNVQSAFLKGNTLEHLLLVNPKNDITEYIQKNETIKIKFEIDTNPPALATYEYKFSALPIPYKIRVYDESSLFAGKIHAVLCRNWKKRVKGRDLYDFEFYIKNSCLLNVKHLEQRMIQTGHILEEGLTIEKVKELLKIRFKEINFEQAKNDVLPFIDNSSKLNVWGFEYFNYLIEQLLDNSITIYYRVFNLSKYGEKKVINEEVIESIDFSGKLHKKNAYKELKNKFNRYLLLDDDIFNFEIEKEKIESYFVIEGFSKIMYFKKNLDIERIISTLKKQ